MQHNENEKRVFWGKINSVNKVKAQTIKTVDFYRTGRVPEIISGRPKPSRLWTFIELKGSQRSSQAVVVHLEKNTWD